eukprot:1866423-Rhodomonas_salina.2
MRLVLLRCVDTHSCRTNIPRVSTSHALLAPYKHARRQYQTRCTGAVQNLPAVSTSDVCSSIASVA